jgi:NhaP-type Na+/H+ or K+/H+ antiporter
MSSVYVMNVLDLVTGPDLALEHALIMLLLLAGLLSIHSGQRRLVPWVILAGVALSLFTPIHTLDITWPLISALVLPPLLWQVAVRLATAHSEFNVGNWLAWLLTVLLIGLALGLGGRLPPASALLLGILAASLVWQVRERATGSTELGAFGQLALALFLAEVDVALHPLGSLLGSLFAGAGLGVLLGYAGVRVAFRLPDGDARNYFCLGLAYVAYWVGALMGGSGVVTATMTGLMVAIYGYHVGLWPNMEMLPAPLKHRGVFAVMGGAFLLLGWQAHVPLTTTRVVGIGLGMVAAAIGIVLGRRLVPMTEALTRSLPALARLDKGGVAQAQAGEAGQLMYRALLRKERKVLLLLLGTLLLWPQAAIVEPWSLVVALVAALIVVLLLRIMLIPVFELFGIEQQSPQTPTPGKGKTPDG